MVAGVNAARYAKGLPPFILPRSSSYIGTLIDDLVTKGVSDPYRMMTSRSEYRLSLRQDNADRRLCELGHSLGLLEDGRYAQFLENKRLLAAEMGRLRAARVRPGGKINALLTRLGSAPLTEPVSAAALLRRPRVEYADIAPFTDLPPDCPPAITESAAVELKYEGYLNKQRQEIERQRRMEDVTLPDGLDYAAVEGLRREAAEKLARVRPLTLGQAARISGVNPADISVLAVWLRRHMG